MNTLKIEMVAWYDSWLYVCQVQLVSARTNLRHPHHDSCLYEC
jgi:hypothetical protein